MKDPFDIKSNKPQGILKAGYLRKKGTRVNVWGDRYFVFRGNILSYYLKSTDAEAKGSYALTSGCRVTEIKSDIYKKKKQFVFCIIFPEEIDQNASSNNEAQANGHGNLEGQLSDSEERPSAFAASSSKTSKRRPRKRIKNSEKEDEGDEKRDGDEKEKSGISKRTAAKYTALAVAGVTVGAVTAGLGLLAGLVVFGLGAAAGGGASAMNRNNKGKGTLMLASDSYQESHEWAHLIKAQIASMVESTDLDKNNHIEQTVLNQSDASLATRLVEVERWVLHSHWSLWSTENGVRIYSLDSRNSRSNDANDDNNFWNGKNGNYSSNHQYSGKSNNNNNSSRRRKSSKGQSGDRSPHDNGLPCLRVNVAINSSVTEAFMALMNPDHSSSVGSLKSLRVVEAFDNYTDIVHITLSPAYIFPTWTSPRDMCLMRYWKQNLDGSYVICLDSTTHDDCPVTSECVRANFHAVYLIVPPLDAEFEEDHSECMVSMVAQMDAGGWLWSSFGYEHQILKHMLLSILDLRDTLDSDRFIQAQFDVAKMTSAALDSEQNQARPEGIDSEHDSVAVMPEPTLPRDMWAIADPSPFRLRGKTYNRDKVKEPSGPHVFQLLAVDLYEVPEPTRNICSHPRNRMALARARGDDTWVFAVNIMVPGPPYLCFVAYMKADPEVLQADTPFGRVARPFFYGNDNEWRNNRFKLIPKIVDGNYLLRTVVKDTPTLLGNKLKQYYFKGDNYFELDVDVGSSAVANRIVGLAIGYSKNIVVDMAFTLQGNEEDELPEVLMSAVRCNHIDTTVAIPL